MGASHGKSDEISNMSSSRISILKHLDALKNHTATVFKESKHENIENTVGEYSDLIKLYKKARKNFEKGNYEKSLRQYEMLLCVQEVNNPNFISIAELQHEVGLVNMKLGKYEDALTDLKKALAVYHTMLPSKHPFLVMLLSNIGFVHLKLGNYDQAFENYFKALEMLKEMSPPNENQVFIGQLMNSIASVFYEKGEYDNALKCLNEAKKKLDPKSYNDLSHLLNNIGLVLFKLERYDEALKYLNESASLQKEIHKTNSSTAQLASTYNMMGRLCREQGKNDLADDYLKKSKLYSKEVK